MRKKWVFDKTYMCYLTPYQSAGRRSALARKRNKRRDKYMGSTKLVKMEVIAFLSKY